jgi:hypothetical protein
MAEMMDGLPSRRELLLISASAAVSQQLLPSESSPAVRVHSTQQQVSIENGHVKATFTRQADGVDQEYYARAGKSWVRVVRALKPSTPRPDGAAPLYSNRGVAEDERVLVANFLRDMRISQRDSQRAVIILSGSAPAGLVSQSISLSADADYFHFEVSASLTGAPPCIEYLLSTFCFESEKVDYTHAPCMKREAANVIGDRVFHSPATVLQSGPLLAALVPDLDILKTHLVYAPEARPIDGPRQFRILQPRETITMPVILDLDFQSGLTTYPVFSFGFADYLTQQHMYWRHDNANGAFVRTLSTNQLRYGFDLFVSADATQGTGYQRVSQHLWARYGSHSVRQPKPQAMPFSEYAAVCYPAAFEYHGDAPEDTKRYAERKAYDPQHSGPLPTWLEFEVEGKPAGGVRATPSQWYYDIQFMGWWNNVHLAQGMSYWGRSRSDQSLIEKARRIISLAVSAPRNDGIFPAVYNYKDRSWNGCYWKMDSAYDPAVLPKYWDFSSDYYQTCSAGKTAALLLRYHRHYEADERIIPYVTPYSEFIRTHLDSNGCLPAWFTRDLQPVPYLRFNAEGGVHIWFLTELFSVTQDSRCLATAQRMADFLIANILPQQRWYDFETFYSCASKPEATYDERTGQWPRCTLSMIWAADGLTGLYEATGVKKYLRAAERVADYLCLYQSVWQPPFIITAYAFGGFISQNSDAEWLDMRQCLCGEALVRLGIVAGRQDFLERGVAALRSAFSVINHPRHIANGIFPTPSYPLGITAENIDHEGLPQLPLRSGSDWGEGGALASAAEVLRQLGGAYVDFSKNTAAGVDGVTLKSAQRAGRQLNIEIDNILARLAVPYEQTFPLELVIAGLPAGEYRVSINKGRSSAISVNGTTRIPITIET